MITRRQIVWCVAAATVAVTLGQSHAAGSGEPVAHEVRIKGFKFVPETLAAKPGDSITFINEDIAPHTATADDKSWDTGTIKKGESVTVEVNEGFATAYFCRFHPKMKATIDTAGTN